jgi:hypothetical protein
MIHSGYEAYDKLSPTYQKFLEGLTAVHDGSGFIKVIFENLVEKRYAHDQSEVRVGEQIL